MNIDRHPEHPPLGVIIPHAGGELLAQCLDALFKSEGVDFETILFYNGVPEGAWRDLPSDRNIKILHSPKRLGFAYTCNRGVDVAMSKYVFLLNDDAIVQPDTLKILLAAMDAQPDLAAVQPKLLSLDHPERFDYSSAAGGELDRYGFPFARGRVFDAIENDRGQYDQPRDVFWGAGAALMVRRDLYISAGGLPEGFFAHMEEIDLQWRLHLMGYRVAAVPAATVRHRGAATIKGGSFLKMYLNQRNSLAMLVRNYGLPNLMKYLPLRLIFEIILLTASLLTLKLNRLAAVLRANFWLAANLPVLLWQRRKVQKLRAVPDRDILTLMYPSSVVVGYFIRQRKTWRDLFPGS